MTIETHHLTRLVIMRGTKADIASGAAEIEEVVLARPTDTDELGILTEALWAWVGSSRHIFVNVSAYKEDGLQAGYLGECQVPAGTIVEAKIYADTAGDATVDVWRSTYDNLPLENADSITASAPITLSSAQKSSDSILSGWTKTLVSGDYLGFNLDNVSGLNRITITLKLEV